MQVQQLAVNLVHKSRGGVMLVQGDAGMGKTHLLQHVARNDGAVLRSHIPKANQLTLLVSGGDASHKGQVITFFLGCDLPREKLHLGCVKFCMGT